MLFKTKLLGCGVKSVFVPIKKVKIGLLFFRLGEHG